MDSLTAHYLARELDACWRGGRVKGCIFDGEGRRILLGVEKSWICIDLSKAAVAVHEAPPSAGGGLLQGWTIRRVYAPQDDRRLLFEFARAGRFKGSAERHATLEISTVPSARGAVLRDVGGARLASLGAKLPPVQPPRPVLDDATLAKAALAGDTETLLTGKWMSPTVVRWLLHEPQQAVAHYQMLLNEPPASPAWCGEQLLPFPMCAAAIPALSLVPPLPDSSAASGAKGHDTNRVARARKRIQAELDRAQAAPQLRQVADALMVLGDVPAPTSIVLSDSTAVPVDVSPGESAVSAAERLYTTIRSMERALQTLPTRLSALEKTEHASHGEVQEYPSASPSTRHPRVKQVRSSYRTYRSSGGLEIWVGRGAASNDELTFHAAAPDDVWLHARDAAGAHVVLRWQRDQSPPARDLEEAAIIAAWHSKARGSTVVPVDWTRRKYVRKLRGAPPGQVVVQRVKTLLVRPEEQIEKKLRTP